MFLAALSTISPSGSGCSREAGCACPAVPVEDESVERHCKRAALPWPVGGGSARGWGSCAHRFAALDDGGWPAVTSNVRTTCAFGHARLGVGA